MKKKLISLALTLIMALCLPMLAFATANTPISSIDLTGLRLGEDWAGKTVSDVKADIAGYSGYASQNVSFNMILFADSNLQLLSDADSFVAGNTYMIQLALQADDGFYFDNDKVVGSSSANYLGTVVPEPLTIFLGSTMATDGANRSEDDTADQMTYCILVYRIGVKGHVHEKGTHHDAVAPTCEAGGTVEYWDCTGCDKKLNADCEEIANIANGDPMGHSFDTENWQTSETEHWHAAICEHTEEKDSIGSHDDSDKDHKCDVCEYVMSECVDENADHCCDFAGCGEKLTECADENKDHKCDFAGCGEKLTECADENKDHKCDFAGCGKKLTECADENKDHKCDFAGCGKKLTECADENKDDMCDVCGRNLSIPKTGDESNLAPYVCMLLISLIGAAVVIPKKKTV